jgi:sterol desaturase/sphingolipid hydroxylase (fatty acid hydroxylase superfamily)
MVACYNMGYEIFYYVSSGYYILITITFFIRKFILKIPYLKFIEYSLSYEIEITNTFIFFAFLIDYLVCFISLFYTKYGKSAKFELDRFLRPIIHGTLNARTYYFTLLCLLRGTKLPILIWLLDYKLNLTEKIKNLFEKNFLRSYSINFYHSHRISHLPKIYEDGHKFHHFFNYASPFDSHIFGVGGPEDWGFFVTELMFCLAFNTIPSTFCFSLLNLNYEFKLSHTNLESKCDLYSYHIDHHVFASKNYCWSPTIDMFFGTSSKDKKYVDGYFIITKEIKDDDIIVTYDLCK